MTTSNAPPRYEDFTRQYIGGEWREGRSSTHTLEDTNPFDGGVLHRSRGASVEEPSGLRYTTLSSPRESVGTI